MRAPNPNDQIETLRIDLTALRKALRLGRVSLVYYRELRWAMLEDLRYWRSFARQEAELEYLRDLREQQKEQKLEEQGR